MTFLFDAFLHSGHYKESQTYLPGKYCELVKISLSTETVEKSRLTLNRETWTYFYVSVFCVFLAFLLRLKSMVKNQTSGIFTQWKSSMLFLKSMKSVSHSVSHSVSFKCGNETLNIVNRQSYLGLEVTSSSRYTYAREISKKSFKSTCHFKTFSL